MANTYNITAKETQPNRYSHLNGSQQDLLDRFAVSEICKAWPVYRDASEWQNHRDAWAEKGAYLWTRGRGGSVDIDTFIEISKSGRATGYFIMHRENSTLVDLNPATGRAVGKMKATITQRFMFPNGACDVECDCRFIWFCKKVPDPSGKCLAEWKAQYVKLYYEKDKVLAIGRQPLPQWDKKLLEKFPEDYRWLGAAQSMIGHDMLYDLPSMNNKGFYELNEAMPIWLDGKDQETAKLLGVPGAS